MNNEDNEKKNNDNEKSMKDEIDEIASQFIKDIIAMIEDVMK